MLLPLVLAYITALTLLGQGVIVIFGGVVGRIRRRRRLDNFPASLC